MCVRLSGLTSQHAVRVGAGMISRGEVGPIVGLENDLIGRDVLSASVIMVPVTTVVTPPLLRLTFPTPKRRVADITVEGTIAGPPEEAGHTP